MSRRRVRWVGSLVAVVVLAVLGFVFIPDLIPANFLRAVADDNCPRLANGAPDAKDIDCHSLSAEGRSPVDEWNREHAKP